MFLFLLALEHMARSECFLYGISMALAASLFFFSGFFWIDAEYGVTGGTLLNLGASCWIPAFIGLFTLVKPKLPVYATWGLPFAILGCLAGANFALVGVNTEIFHLSHRAYLDGYSQYPLSANLLLFWTGPLFPLSLLLLSVQLIRTRTLDSRAAILLGLGSIAFPISRIGRDPWVTHVADLLLVLAMAYYASHFIRKGMRAQKKFLENR